VDEQHLAELCFFRELQGDELPAFTAKYTLADFLIENYELFHLYPDEAVFDEIDREIARQANV
jgi:hypothetical protein